MATDDLIAALQGVGEVDSIGHFSFDREKAREKLRTFQVAEPQRYVLHLVALAGLKGATAVEVECDSDDLWVRFDGAPVTAEDLDDLYNSSFAAAHSDEQRARQQLAVGLHAALALNPRHVRLTSGAVALVARHDRPDEITASAGAAGRTEIHVKQRFRPGLLVRFVSHLRGNLAEATWLRERGRYASLPISLNGQAISGGLKIAGAEHCRSGELEGCRGVAGLMAGPVPVGCGGVIRLVRHGVWICDEPRGWLPDAMIVVVASDRLITDLSGDKVVQDGEHARALALALDLAAQVVAAALGPEAAVIPDEPLMARLGGVWRGWPGALDPTTVIGAAMARIVAFKDIWGRWHNLATLHAVVAQRGGLPTTAGSFVERLPVGDEFVYQRGDAARDGVIDQAFGERCRDVTAALEQRARTEANRRRWRAQPAEPRLNPASYSLTAPFGVTFGDRRVAGEIGLRRAASTSCGLRVIVEGCVLAELEMEAPIAGIDAVIAGPLAIVGDYSGVVRDELFAAVLVAWLTASRVLADTALRRGAVAWPPGPASEALRHGLLRSLYRAEAVRAVLRAGGYTGDELTRRHDELTTWVPDVPIEADLAEQPWMRDAFQFTAASGQRLTVGAVAVGLKQGVPLRWVPEECEGHPGITAPVLRTTPREREVLRWLFGGKLRRMDALDYERLRGEAELRARPEVELGLPGDTHLPGVVVERGGTRVALAFVASLNGWRAASHRATCQIYYAGRPVAPAMMWSPVLGVAYAIAGDRLTPRPSFDGFVPDNDFHAALADAAAAAPALVERALDEVAADPGGEAGACWRRGVLAALVATLPTPNLRAAQICLNARCGREEGEAQYLRLLALAAASSVDSLSRELDDRTSDVELLQDTRLLATRVGVPPPTDSQVEALGAVLRSLRELLGQTGGDAWLDDICTFSPEVAALPLLQRVDGSTMTLAEARADAKAGGLHIYLTRGDSRPPAYLRSLRVDAQTRDLLACLFGGHALRSEAPVLVPPELGPPELGPVKLPTRRKPWSQVDAPPRAAVDEDPPPTAEDLAALFADLQREAEAKPARPEPAPDREPPGPAVAPPPGPGERLIAAVRAELEALRRGHESLLTGFNLEHVRAVEGDGQAIVGVGRDGLVLDLAHPLVRRALERYADDRPWVSFLASSVYTALNVWREDITDADEAKFHARHLAWLRDQLEA